MIKKELLKLLQERLNLKETQTRNRIEKMRKEIGYGYTYEIAAYVLAYENDVDPSPYIKAEELAEYREAIQTRRIMGHPPTPQTPARTPEDKTRRRRTPQFPKPVVVQIPEMEQLDVPNLPKAVVDDAKEMAKIYPIVYLFENSVREFIKEVLDKQSPDWWDRVNQGIKDRVESRQRTEKQNAYHGKTRVHPIQYVDFDDLGTIIGANAVIFNEYMPDKNIEYIRVKLREVKDSRNTLMHCNPLTEDDMRRVRLYLADWVRQLKVMLEILHTEP